MNKFDYPLNENYSKLNITSTVRLPAQLSAPKKISSSKDQISKAKPKNRVQLSLAKLLLPHKPKEIDNREFVKHSKRTFINLNQMKSISFLSQKNFFNHGTNRRDDTQQISQLAFSEPLDMVTGYLIRFKGN